MAFTVHPVGSASGFTEESELDSELHRLLHAFGGRMSDFVILPFSQNHFDLTNPSGLDAQIATGDAMTGGHLTRMDAAETRTLTASTTSEVFLVVDDAKTGNADIVAQDKATADPTGQYVVKLWEATTDGSTITGTTDFRPYVPFPNEDPQESVTGVKDTPQGTPNPPSVSTDSTGIKTVSVTFDRPYRVEVFDVVASLSNVTDTAVNLGWVKTSNITLTGFDIDVKVTKSGASGSTADMAWNARGH